MVRKYIVTMKSLIYIVYDFSFIYKDALNSIMTATTFLVFYRFKAMTKEEKQKTENEWHQLKNSLPLEIELVGEYVHSWGTRYN